LNDCETAYAKSCHLFLLKIAALTERLLQCLDHQGLAFLLSCIEEENIWLHVQASIEIR